MKGVLGEILNVHVFPPEVNPVLINHVPLSSTSENPDNLNSCPAISPPERTLVFVTPDFHCIVIVLDPL